jgi:hypothetical protein
MSPTRERPRNMAASVRERLTQQARSRSANVQLVMTRYAIERLLYRLSLSRHREGFVLKGAMLFAVWAHTPYRTTADLDLLGSGDPAPQLLARAIREVCSKTYSSEYAELYSIFRLTNQFDVMLFGWRLASEILPARAA